MKPWQKRQTWVVLGLSATLMGGLTASSLTAAEASPYRYARDRDRDGIPDYRERRARVPFGYVARRPVRDQDRDGIADYRDRDRDGDGIRNDRDRHPNTPDRYRFRSNRSVRDRDWDGTPDYRDRDRDGDRVPNRRDRHPNDRWRR